MVKRANSPATPITRTTLTASAFEQLISHVVNGDWTAGERIPPERELCQQLGIARTSLREALKAMELIGMLDSRVGDGTFVCPRSEFLARPLLWAFTGTDQTELRDIMEARVLLERDLAGLAAERGSVEEVEQIGCAARAMKEHFIAGRQILNAEMSFHLAVAAAAHNEVLTNAVQLLRNLTRQWIQLRLTTPRVPQKVIKQHQEVYEAIRLHDPERARAAMWAHVSETSVSVATVVAQRSKSTGDLRVSKSLIAVR